jgi:hypothetical protein
VHFTAAANANFFLQEDDASSASLNVCELPAVGATQVTMVETTNPRALVQLGSDCPTNERFGQLIDETTSREA